MRVYLDNCCYNRPFDDQSSLNVMLETFAKLRVQELMRSGVIEYVWSDMLVFEVSHNPFRDRQRRFLEWIPNAAIYVRTSDEVLARARDFQAMGLKYKDSVHVASAERAQCDWLLTTDNGILKKVSNVGNMRVANPIEFMMEEGHDEL